MDPHDPLSFRYFVQPLLAILLGFREGRRDAAEGRPPYAMSLLTGRHHRREWLRQGLSSVALPLSVAIVLDGLVQWMVAQRVLLWQAVLTGIVLIGLPYILSRGLSNRIEVRLPQSRQRRRV